MSTGASVGEVSKVPIVGIPVSSLPLVGNIEGPVRELFGDKKGGAVANANARAVNAYIPGVGHAQAARQFARGEKEEAKESLVKSTAVTAGIGIGWCAAPSAALAGAAWVAHAGVAGGAVALGGTATQAAGEMATSLEEARREACKMGPADLARRAGAGAAVAVAAPVACALAAKVAAGLAIKSFAGGSAGGVARLNGGDLAEGLYELGAGVEEEKRNVVGKKTLKSQGWKTLEAGALGGLAGLVLGGVVNELFGAHGGESGAPAPEQATQLDGKPDMQGMGDGSHKVFGAPGGDADNMEGTILRIDHAQHVDGAGDVQHVDDVQHDDCNRDEFLRRRSLFGAPGGDADNMEGTILRIDHAQHVDGAGDVQHVDDVQHDDFNRDEFLRRRSLFGRSLVYADSAGGVQPAGDAVQGAALVAGSATISRRAAAGRAAAAQNKKLAGTGQSMEAPALAAEFLSLTREMGIHQTKAEQKAAQVLAQDVLDARPKFKDLPGKHKKAALEDRYSPVGEWGHLNMLVKGTENELQKEFGEAVKVVLKDTGGMVIMYEGNTLHGLATIVMNMEDNFLNTKIDKKTRRISNVRNVSQGGGIGKQLYTKSFEMCRPMPVMIQNAAKDPVKEVNMAAILKGAVNNGYLKVFLTSQFKDATEGIEVKPKLVMDAHPAKNNFFDIVEKLGKHIDSDSFIFEIKD